MKKQNIREVSLQDIKTKTKNQLIVKSNKLIEARYKLTIQEQRLILLMVSMIEKDDQDFQPYRIKVSEFMKIVGKKGQSDYHDMKGLTRRLLERVIVIKEPDGDRQTHWVSVAKYHDRKGYVDLHFDPKLKEVLLMLKESFTDYKLKDVIRLKSYYSIRIFELLKQYKKNIKKRTFELNELREILGIDKNQYKLYGHFKNKVILPAQEELSQKCDFTFKLKEIKKSRRVVALEFTIINTKKNKECLELINKVGETESESLAERLQKYHCFPTKTAQEIINKYSTERIIKNLAYVEEKIKTGKINDIGAYTLKAIKENYTLQRSQFDIDKEEKEREKEAKVQQELRDLELKKKYARYCKEEIDKYKKSLPQEDIEILEKKFAAKQTNKQNSKKMQEIFARRELEKHFVKEAKIPSFEQWKKDQIAELKN